MSDEEFLSFWHEIESERIPGAEVPADDVIRYFEANPLPEETGKDYPAISFKLNQFGLAQIYQVLKDKRCWINGDFCFSLNTNNAGAYNYLCH